MELWFYKGKGGLLDWFIRKGTRSPYSHVELCLDPVSGLCVSSSWVDGGVRAKFLSPKSPNWERLEVPLRNPLAVAEIHSKFHQIKGAKYDVLGIVFTEILNIRRDSPGRYYCSELCAELLGLDIKCSPGALHALCRSLWCEPKMNGCTKSTRK